MAEYYAKSPSTCLAGVNQKQARHIEALLGDYFTRTGLPIDALNALAADRQVELRRLFNARSAENAEHLRSKETGLRQSVAGRRAALQPLSLPFQSTFLTLDQPSLIWEYPFPDLMVEYQYLPGKSFIKMKGVDHPMGSYSTQFVFDFFWSNDSEFAAVIDVETSLVFSGVCDVGSASGIFSGDRNFLSLSAQLVIFRSSGWGTDPVTGQSLDQTNLSTQTQTVSYLDVTGNGLFGGEATKKQWFDAQPFDLTENSIIVPGGAFTQFSVAVNLSYYMEDPGNISDGITFDFADNTWNRQIVCPSLILEILTPVSGVDA